MIEPWFEDASLRLWHGDCIEVLRALPDASVDAVVCDPPYGLEFMGKAWDRLGDIGKASHQGFSDAATNFKGMALPSSYNASTNLKCQTCGRWKFDHVGRKCECGPDAVWPNVKAQQGRAMQDWHYAWAAECLRVLKPGGHMLAFGGTRTWHRLACAVEDAGFEVRDSIAWLYGSGFPKSLDVSKAIDKAATVNDETVRRIAAVAEVIRTHREASGLTRAEVSQAVVGTPSGACWNWEHQQLPSVEMWPAIKATLGIPDKYDGLIEGDRARFIAAEREVIAQREGTRRPGFSGATYGEVVNGAFADTAPATDAARTWQGWGTALKPAFEPVVVARKPLSGTVAANVLAHGTGALNIGGCRVATDEPFAAHHGTNGAAGVTYGQRAAYVPGSANAENTHTKGRWPANVVLDSETAAELDRQSGTLTSGANPTRRGADKGRTVLGEFAGQDDANPQRGVDSGGASRFFPTFRYQAKAPTSERPKADGVAHPTVKPLALMRWLVRLVTPPGGIVLDPFAGSGTTVEAALLEGMVAWACEREEDYLPLIAQRVVRAHAARP